MLSKKKTNMPQAPDVIKKEKDYINKAKSPEEKDFWGIGISGGGIRSASVGLGVLQALVNAPGKSLLSRMDYLSTVSGGGYIGSALTWFLHKGMPDGKPAGTDKNNFPLGHIGSGARSNPKGNIILDFIRQHGNYLLPGQGIDVLSLLGVTLRSMFISLFVYFLILTSVMVMLKYITLFDCISPGTVLEFNLPAIPLLLWIIIAITVLLLVVSFIFSIRTYIRMGSVRRYKNQIRGQKFLGMAWKLIFISALLVSLVYVEANLSNIYYKISAVVSSLSFGTIIGFFHHKKSVDDSQSSFPNSVIYLASFALIYGVMLSAYLFSIEITTLIYFLILLAITLIFGILVNLNYVGLHRMYRDRLMETFLANANNINANKWGPASEADDALLEKMCDVSPRPYHLINTNIVLVDSPTAKFRGRGGDSFLLSKLFCGSDATGFVPTDEYLKNSGRGMTLATAMAISGAAVNPNTGSGGRGLTRNALVSTLMGMLNLRLGYWARNPNSSPKIPAPPNFIKPGLNGDVLGGNLSEDKDEIQLTDGGHFENLALYELIRRKLKVIIISDAGADVNYQFSDLANAIEKVRVDFGVTIRFDEDFNLDKLLPGSCKGEELYVQKYQLSENGFAIANINYHDKENTKGKLIYIKSTLIDNLPADIYGYKSANLTFPNQTTANQFFNEEQFEAYRELGYQLTWQMMKSEKGKEILGLVL